MNPAFLVALGIYDAVLRVKIFAAGDCAVCLLRHPRQVFCLDAVQKDIAALNELRSGKTKEGFSATAYKTQPAVDGICGVHNTRYLLNQTPVARLCAKQVHRALFN